MTNQIVNVKPLTTKSKTHDVYRNPSDMENVYRVVSGNTSNEYIVVLRRDGQSVTCNCGWGSHRGWFAPQSGCSHGMAVITFVNTQDGRTPSFWNNQDDAKKQHRPVTQMGDGVIVTTRKGTTKSNPVDREAQILKELGF